jgi:hypothetical protein
MSHMANKPKQPVEKIHAVIKRRAAMPNSIIVVPDKADAVSLRLVQSILKQHGFKWFFRGGTDLCKDDIDISLKRDRITVTYLKRLKRGFISGSSGSVFSRSVGKVTKIEIPTDLNARIPFVYVSSPVQHFDWDGKLVDV